MTRGSQILRRCCRCSGEIQCHLSPLHLQTSFFKINWLAFASRKQRPCFLPGLKRGGLDDCTGLAADFRLESSGIARPLGLACRCRTKRYILLFHAGDLTGLQRPSIISLLIFSLLSFSSNLFNVPDHSNAVSYTHLTLPTKA